MSVEGSVSIIKMRAAFRTMLNAHEMYLRPSSWKLKPFSNHTSMFKFLNHTLVRECFFIRAEVCQTNSMHFFIF